jgi:hypothetical protein
MPVLLLKLIVTPLLIASATLSAKRWGQLVSGWLVGMPLTSGPILAYLTMEHGCSFAAHAALGSLGGAAAQAGFVVGYCRSARYGWPYALLAGTAGFLAVGLLVQQEHLATLPLLALVLISLALALVLVPQLPYEPPQNGTSVANKLWLRMLISTGVVLTITTLAPRLGPELSGLLGTFPLFASLLAIFSQQTYGPVAATHVLRGLLLGLFAFSGFFALIGCSITTLGAWTAFGLALLLTLAIQGGSLWWICRRSTLLTAA